jgi:two-component system, cell cycle sensor histidine kinase and response regulator CckA
LRQKSFPPSQLANLRPLFQGALILRTSTTIGSSRHHDDAIRPTSEPEGAVEILGSGTHYEEKLRQAHKLAIVSRLVAHGFNNQLMVIGSYAELMLDELTAGDPQRASVERVLEASNRAAALTKKLFEFSPLSSGSANLLSINDFVSGLADELHRHLGPEVKLSTEVDRTLVWTEIDPLQLRQAVLSVATNSREAMPSGGQFTIAVSHLDSGQGSTPVALSSGPYVTLSLTDTGSGMDKDTYCRLFEPFFSTKSAQGKRGMGLVMVRSLVKQSGGNVSVRSELGKGTTVTIYLPELTSLEGLPIQGKSSLH